MALLSPPPPSPTPVAVALRPATPADASALHAWRAESSVRRHQPLQNASVSDLRSDLARQRPGDLYRSRGDRYQWIVVADGRPVGWVTLAVTSWEQGIAEVGYALTSGAQGRGVMTQALSLLLADLFGQTAIERLEARCSVDNEASRRVLEKVGFTCEGLLRGYFSLDGRRVDNHLFAVLRSDLLVPARY